MSDPEWEATYARIAEKAARQEMRPKPTQRELLRETIYGWPLRSWMKVSVWNYLKDRVEEVSEVE